MWRARSWRGGHEYKVHGLGPILTDCRPGYISRHAKLTREAGKSMVIRENRST